MWYRNPVTNPKGTSGLRIACVMRTKERLVKSLWLNAQRFLRRIPKCLFRAFDPREHAVAALADWQPDAIIAHISSKNLYGQLTEIGCPLVNTSGLLAGLPIPSVGPDNLQIGRLAADHLLGKGYRRFAFIGDLRWAHFALQRLDGFRQQVESKGFQVELWEHGIQDRGSILHQEELSERNRRLLDWVEQLPDRTGLFADDDNTALAICDLARIVGLDLPGRFAMVSGHDMDTPCQPSLSGVQIPEDQWGYEAARLAVASARGEVDPTPAASVLLPPLGIVERESSSQVAVEDEYLREAMRFIRTHAGEMISVEDVSQAASLGRRALERRFRGELGRTILQEIHRTHVEHAKMLLAETDLSTHAIARESGLSDEKHLRRLMVKFEGVLPSEYRDQFRVK